MNKLIYILLSVSLIILSTSVYYYFNRDKFYIGNGFKIDNINSFSTSMTPNIDIVPPKLNNNFSISFWIYIDDFYENYNYWKHILHKGSEISGILNYKYWYNIETEIPKQNLGLWMHPNQNNLRLAISTIVDTNHPNTEHPEYETASKTFEKNQYKETLETCDITDIPSKTLIHYSIVVDGQTITIYKNSKVHKIHGLNGRPILNLGNMYFNNQKTYSGKLHNFIYYPYKTDINKVKSFFKDKPSIN